MERKGENMWIPPHFVVATQIPEPQKTSLQCPQHTLTRPLYNKAHQRPLTTSMCLLGGFEDGSKLDLNTFEWIPGSHGHDAELQK